MDKLFCPDKALRGAQDDIFLTTPRFMPAANLSYWEHQSFFGPAEVAIIGAGLVGLSAALYLKQRRPAWRVVVLERGPLPSGASTKNAGFACFGSISELLEQEQRGDLQAVVAARCTGLARLRELVGDAALDFQPVGGYELFRHEEAALAAECRSRIGYFNDLLAPVVGHARTFRDASAEAGRFGFRGVGTLLKNECEGSLDAGRIMRALLARAWAADVPVLTNCAVEAVETTANNHRLRLANGASLAAGQVLLATNAFATELLPGLAVTPGRGQVLVTEPLPGVHLPGTFHYDRGYAYFRQLPDHRVLLGGGRNLDFAAEATTAPGLTEAVQAYLENLLHDVVLPGRRPRIDYRWSGVMGFGPALAPLIDWARPGVLAAVRCNGMGVAMGADTGWRAAEKLANS
ncbi:MAG: FAD-dependent oxidoreductase [Hymenobacter sp.]